MSSFSGEMKFFLPKTETLYGQFGDSTTLRAFKILSVRYGRDIGESYLRVFVAGLGEGYVSAKGTYYETKEDYVCRKRTGALTEAYLEALNEVKANIGELGTLFARPLWQEYVIRRYAWIDNECQSGVVYLRAEYDVQAKKLTLSTSERDGFPYATKEECVMDNMVDVAELEVDPVPEPQEFIVNLPKQVPVTAKTAEEAEAKVAESIRNLVNQ